MGGSRPNIGSHHRLAAGAVRLDFPCRQWPMRPDQTQTQTQTRAGASRGTERNPMNSTKVSRRRTAYRFGAAALVGALVLLVAPTTAQADQARPATCDWTQWAQG